MDLEEFKSETFAEKHRDHLLIFCVATHYEGDPCDNTKKIYRWLRDQRKQKDLNKDVLKGIRFVVFGLGDTSYEQYNAIGKFFNEALEELGGERAYKYGEGNAEGNKTEDDFNEWKADMWSELSRYFAERPVRGGANSQSIEEVKEVKVDAHVITAPSDEAKPAYKAQPLVIQYGTDFPPFEESTPLELASKQYLTSKELSITQITELRPDTSDGGSTLEVTFDLTNTGITYKTAHNLAFFPENSQDDV